MAITDDKRAQAQRDGVSLSGANDATPPAIVVSDGFQPDMDVPDVPELGAAEENPPAYSEFHDQFSLHQAGFDADAAVTDDGRIDININQTSRQLADIIAPTLRNQLRSDARIAAEAPLPPAYIPPSLGGQPGQTPPPKLNIVIQIVGSRGDVQPFVALGQVLRDTYGHRVRVATHGTFQKFVEENGLEFFCIGGDPAELMAFMVKNPGLMPGFDAMKSGEITKRRKGIEEIIWGCWRSCIEAGDGLGPAPRSQRKAEISAESVENARLMFLDKKPFVADAIIANPPSFAHIHVAEKLGIPLHLMFTMPWSPTRAFPQPLANIQSSNTDPVTTNYVSYALVEMMTWQGLGDVINRFRTKVLDLEPLSLLWAPSVLTRLRIPYTYCWSPALIPKPADWGNHIDIAGFYFLNLASNYTPEPDLAAFLAAGPPPVYIGFGSIVVDDPNGLTRKIFDAVAETGVRALVSKGWGGLGADSVGIPDGVFMLGNVPHDWLFEHVSAVCHHGGAGTTAAGINAGKPTIIVPFFGDQPFWGAMVARAGAGPDPIPYKKLTGEGLAEAIRVATKQETLERARELGAKIREEQGTDVGGQFFHQHLDVDKLRCSVAPSRVAVWRVRRTQTRLSALAAASLVSSGYLQYTDLKLFRSKEYSTENEPWDPISAVTAALIGDIGTIGMAVADFPRDVFKAKKGSKSKSQDNLAGDEPSKSSSTTGASSEGPKDSTASLNTLTSPASQTSNNPTSTSRASSAAAASQQPALSSGLNENLERALGAGKSINNIVGTGMKTPMNFCMGLARGFRNAPRLYNDDTVRTPDKVTGLGSGLKVAGKEFGYGMFDGITGLVTQPMKGAEKEGAAGLLKGFAKGIAGIALKPAAGAWAIPAYAMAGVHAEIRSMFAQSAEHYILASRIGEGSGDLNNSSAEEREDIETRWLTIRNELRGDIRGLKAKEKGKARDASAADPSNVSGPPKTGWMHTKNLSFEERKKLQEEKKAWKRRQAEAGHFLNEDVSSLTNAHNDEEFEEAIQTAVQETSRGDPVEDARIEQAIRSSVVAFRKSSLSKDSMPSSVSTPHGRSARPTTGILTTSYPADTKVAPVDELENITDEEYQALIEQAVQMSIADKQQQAIQMYDLEGDEELQKAIEASRAGRAAGSHTESDNEALIKAIEASQADHKPTSEGADDEEMKRAIEESERAHKEELARASSMKSEEDIIMEYIKKQSLAEEEMRKKGKKDTSAEEDDEGLRIAMEESLRYSGRGSGRDNGSGDGSSRQS